MPVYVWLILAAIFLIIEIFTAGFFIACFTVGALAAAIVSYFAAIPLFWQCLIFVIVSVGLIPVSRLFAKRLSDDTIPQAGADALIGKTAIVIEDIEPVSGTGQVRVDGEAWRALASDKIKKSTTVKIISVKGTMLEVEPIEGSE